MKEKINITWFNHYYDRIMGPLERRSFRAIRSRLLERAEGCVLEVGSGTGINFEFYRNAVVTAVEPDPVMRARSLARAQAAPCPVRVREGDAQALDFPEHSFDTVVGTLVLCTVPDPRKAVQEMKRVCKPGGSILLLEHVRVAHPVMGTIQDVLAPLWKRCFDGCCINRDTVQLLREEGIGMMHRKEYCRSIVVTVEGMNPYRA